MSASWTLNAGNGVKTVYVQFRDAAGNVSLSYNDTIALDSNEPVAHAGTDISTNPDQITLDGSQSSDPDHDQLTYSWSQLSGPQVEISNNTSNQARFLGIKAGIYTFQLTVSDAWCSSIDTVNVTINNIAPTADPGTDKAVNINSEVILAG